MKGLWKRWIDRWANWLGDRDLELAMRGFLSEQGFCGDSAKFSNVRLAAIQRPGWQQIFVFKVDAKVREPAAEYGPLFGLVRQDERYDRLEIRVFRAQQERNALFEEWSRDLIRVRMSRS